MDRMVDYHALAAQKHWLKCIHIADEMKLAGRVEVESYASFAQRSDTEVLESVV